MINPKNAQNDKMRKSMVFGFIGGRTRVTISPISCESPRHVIILPCVISLKISGSERGERELQ